MISAFHKSRLIAWVGGISLGGVAAVIAYLLLRERLAGFSLLAVPALSAFVAANIAVYAARIVSTKEYHTLLLFLYEELNPQKLLDALLSLLERRISPQERCTLMVHIANGHLYAGDPHAALDTLDSIPAPEQALELRGQVAGNKAACHLALGDLKSAQLDLDALRLISGHKACKRELSLKLRRTVAYLQCSLDIQRNKNVDLALLEKDYESCRAPLHKLDVAYRLALLSLRNGDEAKFTQYRDYVAEHGAKTALPALLVVAEA